jgi:hypothetical protein
MRAIVCSACNGALPAHSVYCPHCGQSVSGSDRQGLSKDLQVMEELTEIDFHQLTTADYILIQTRNNLYKFTLVEPADGYGILSGGALGNQQFQCGLLGTVCCKKAKSVAHPLTLKVGMTAVFYLGADDGQPTSGESRRQVATSPITRLTRVGGGKITGVRDALPVTELRIPLAELPQK